MSLHSILYEYITEPLITFLTNIKKKQFEIYFIFGQDVPDIA